VVQTTHKAIILQQLYQDYIQKDIIEILKVGHPDNMQKLIGLLAHSSGQLVNYQTLGTDAQIGHHVLKNYLSILEKTYTISEIKPYVGNKRKEITSNPIYYFIDNGFRNQVLKNFVPLESRNDKGLLVQSIIFQELLKFKTQNFLDFDINFWRTQSGAEVDFVLKKDENTVIPIESKYQTSLKITRSLRSFLEAYSPKVGFVITKNIYQTITVNTTTLYFFPLSMLPELAERLKSILRP
jgi:predicted AAA+ superfamily ATPase